MTAVGLVLVRPQNRCKSTSAVETTSVLSLAIGEIVAALLSTVGRSLRPKMNVDYAMFDYKPAAAPTISLRRL